MKKIVLALTVAAFAFASSLMAADKPCNAKDKAACKDKDKAACCSADKKDCCKDKSSCSKPAPSKSALMSPKAAAAAGK